MVTIGGPFLDCASHRLRSWLLLCSDEKQNDVEAHSFHLLRPVLPAFRQGTIMSVYRYERSRVASGSRFRG